MARRTSFIHGHVLAVSASEGRPLNKEASPIRLDVYRVLRTKGNFPVHEAIPLAQDITENGVPSMIPLSNGKIVRIRREEEPRGE